jgi:hypothetical protein
MADKVDLSLTGQEDPSDKNYYLVKVSGLKLYTLYDAKFQWSFQEQALNDRVKSIWSNGFAINTLNIPALPKPKLVSTDIRRSQGNIVITWSGVDATNTAYGSAFKRIDVYVRNNSDASPYFQLLGFIDKVGGAFAFPANPNSYTIRIAAISLLGDQSVVSDEFTVSAITDAPSVPSGLSAVWSGTDFTVSFTHDTTAPANAYLKEYIVNLTPPLPTLPKAFPLTPTAGSSQKFSMSLERNQAAFGDAQTEFSGTITSVDIYNNKSAPIAFANVAYTSPLTAPVITASAISNGYTVSYTAQTSNVFNLISIEEVESSAATAPATGYAVVKTDRSNPSIVSAPNNNKRWVRARLNDKANAFTGYSNIVAVTPVSPVVVDVDGPSNVTTVETSGGLGPSGVIGFNGYADISWNSVTGNGIRGYRVRYKATNSTKYSYADSSGTATSTRITGLGAGLEYEIAVATYDEYNNTSSSYIAGPNVSVGGTPYIATTVDVTGYFSAKANAGDAANTAFKFGYGVDTGKRGLVFNASNYWYIDSDQSASLKVGGSTANFIQWDGAKFTIDGNLQAKQGTFSGNVQLASGASVYSGALTGETVETSVVNGVTITTKKSGGALNGAGYILNSSGLTFNSSSISGITTIDATTGKLTTQSALIGSWDVNSSTLFKTTAAGTLSLNSSNASITTDSTGYTSGIGVPDTSADVDLTGLVMWAGATKKTAPFKVFKDGTVKATQLTITGYATTLQLDGKIGASDVNSNVTSISGAVITSGVIKSGNFPGTYVSPEIPQTANGAGYSKTGTAIDLVNGTITSKQFRIDSSGNAHFVGALTSGVSVTAPNIIGLTALSAGTVDGNGIYPFYVNSAGKLTAKGAEISGAISGGSFTLASYESTNKWMSGEFRAGSATTYVQALSSGSATLYAADTSTTEADLDSSSASSYLTLNIPSQVKVTPTAVQIYGLPGVGNGLTASGTLVNQYTGTGAADEETTQYRSAYAGNTYVTAGNLPSYNYGKAARYRMIIADPYDNNMLKRGLGIYYGTLSNAPGASAGFVGDLWVSW